MTNRQKMTDFTCKEMESLITLKWRSSAESAERGISTKIFDINIDNINIIDKNIKNLENFSFFQVLSENPAGR